ncbi:hypothetical protein Tco_0832310 [Tanacetum coccineum]
MGTSSILELWYEDTLFYLLDNGFHKGQIDKTLFIKRLKGDILLVLDEFNGRTYFLLGFTSQAERGWDLHYQYSMETHKALTKDEDGEDVDVHLYKSMIGSLMYLTSLEQDFVSQFVLALMILNSDYAGVLGQEIHKQEVGKFPWFKSWRIQDETFQGNELEIPKLKRAEPVKRQSTKEEKKRDDSSKPSEGRRKKTLAMKRASGKDSEESMKKQKLEDDTKKEDLKAYLDIILGDDVALDIKSLATKYPILNPAKHK